MVKECMVILTNMTEEQSKILSKILKEPEHDYLVESTAPVVTNEENLNNVDLSALGVVNIDGIMLPIYDNNNVQSGNLVPVKSTTNNLRSLVLAVASGNSVLIVACDQFELKKC